MWGMSPNKIPAHMPMVEIQYLHNLLSRAELLRLMGCSVTEHHVPRARFFGFVIRHVDDPEQHSQYFYCKPLVQVVMGGNAYKLPCSEAQVEAGLDALRESHPELFWPNPEQVPNTLCLSDQELQSLWATGQDDVAKEPAPVPHVRTREQRKGDDKAYFETIREFAKNNKEYFDRINHPQGGTSRGN